MCKHDDFLYVWLDGELKAIDRCISTLVLQLNLAGIKTSNSCCGHGKGYPNVTCEPGTEEALKKFGCKIVVPRQGDAKVEAYFPVNCFSGKVYMGDPH